jgi:hypothetical protein
MISPGEDEAMGLNLISQISRQAHSHLQQTSRLAQRDLGNLAGAAHSNLRFLNRQVQNDLTQIGRVADLGLQALSPVQQGALLRQLDSARQLSSMKLPGIDLNPFDDIWDAIKDAADALRDAGEAVVGKVRDGLEWLQERVQDLIERLSTLPHEAADRLANSMRGPHARDITAGERAELEKIFGDSIDLDNVRIVRGPGTNPAALAAFENGNPAITIGDTVYVRGDVYDRLGSDFSKSPEGLATLAHEFAHVRQYQQMGYGSFYARYASEYADAGGDASEMYDYQSRPNTTYATETIEGQAEMVGDYAELKAKKDSGVPLSAEEKALMKDIEGRLKGTGIFGF